MDIVVPVHRGRTAGDQTHEAHEELSRSCPRTVMCQQNVLRNLSLEDFSLVQTSQGIYTSLVSSSPGLLSLDNCPPKTDTQSHTHKDIQTYIDTYIQTHTHRDICRHTERHTDINTDTDRHRHRVTQTYTDTQRHIVTHTYRHKHT